MNRVNFVIPLIASAIVLQGCGNGDDDDLPLRPFTSWDNVGPNEVVVIDGNVIFASYQTDLNSGVTTTGDTQRTDAEARLTYDGNSELERINIGADAASVDFDEDDGDDIGLVFANLVGGAISADGEEIGLWAEPEGSGFHYQTFGVWLTGYNTGVGVAAAGSFGAMTPQAGVPTAGVLTYNGSAAGFAVDAAGTPFFVVSDSEVVADFPAGTFTFGTSGSLKDNLVDATELAFVGDTNFNLSGAGNIVGNSLEGNVSTTGYDMDGDIEAWLYGPDASEVGGLFEVAGPDGKYAGSFGAVD